MLGLGKGLGLFYFTLTSGSLYFFYYILLFYLVRLLLTRDEHAPDLSWTEKI